MDRMEIDDDDEAENISAWLTAGCHDGIIRRR
jgi:hypothetical protein